MCGVAGPRLRPVLHIWAWQHNSAHFNQTDLFFDAFVQLSLQYQQYIWKRDSSIDAYA